MAGAAFRVRAVRVAASRRRGQPAAGESLRSLHRDWGWTESDENARALACVEKVVCAPLGRTLVLGAGACRLAYDLARRDPAALLIALDDDPLVLLAAARVLRGETVSLTEAREHPTEIARLSAVRALRVPHGPATRVVPLLADGLAPPFRPGAFDTVLTPWFIDVAGADRSGQAPGPIPTFAREVRENFGAGARD